MKITTIVYIHWFQQVLGDKFYFSEEVLEEIYAAAKQSKFLVHYLTDSIDWKITKFIHTKGKYLPYKVPSLCLQGGSDGLVSKSCLTFV